MDINDVMNKTIIYFFNLVISHHVCVSDQDLEP